jgi:hypothetical protein
MEQTSGQRLKHTHTSKVVDESSLMARLHKGYADLKHQIHKVIVGQDEVIDSTLCCMLAGGHCIVQGVPGALILSRGTHSQSSDDMSSSRGRFSQTLFWLMR